MTDVLKKFGRYFLLDKLAQGGMAEIYRARLASKDGAGRLLVIKRMASTYGNNAEFLKMFQSEIKVTMGFNHPNIVQLYDFGEEQAQPYIAMEFVDGRTLRQFMGKSIELKQNFPVELAAYVIAQCCSGLHYAHDYKDKITGEHLSIVHRDISPQNILISFDGAVKVIDFGIAKATVTGEATRVGVIKGKPSYLSPEQITGEVLDGRCDIFALGIVLWELLAGRKLFSAENDLATIKLIESCQNHVVAPSTYNPKVPKELDYIVLKALAKQREKRYQTADEFQRVLHKFLYAFMTEFNPADLAYFSKELFKDEIVKDRKKFQELSNRADELLALDDNMSIELSGMGGQRDEKTVLGPRGVAATGARDVFSRKELEKAEHIRVEPVLGVGAPRSAGRSATVERSVPKQSVLARQAPKDGGRKRWIVSATAAAVLVALVAPELGIQIPVLSEILSRGGAPGMATLVLEGDNKSVTVLVNNQNMGTGLPRTLKNLPPGKPLFVQVKGPSGSFEQEFILSKGESKVVPVQVGTNVGMASSSSQDRTPAAGKTVLLHLNITPGGGHASVSISGKPVDPANPVTLQPLDTALELVVERQGFRPFKREFVLQSQQIGEQREWSMDVALEPISYGFLSIHTTPSNVNAIITLDGKPWVLKTPIDNEKMPIGVYNIRLVHEVLGMEKTITVNIQDQKIVTLDVGLEIKD